MEYSKAPEQPASSARPICHSHTMTSTGRKPVTIHIAAYQGACCAMHCATGDDNKVTMLTHTYPNKPLRKIKVTICNHQADNLF